MGFNVLGLSEATERVYAALVGLPRCTASELAAACGLSPAMTARQLSLLVKDGLANRGTGRPPRFSAAAPDVAVTALIQEREHELDRARSLVERLTETHREAARISDPHMAVELLTDRDEVSAAVRRLTAEARSQVRAFDRPPYVDRPGSNLAFQVQRQRTGVVHRVIYDREALAWPGRLANDIVPSIRTGEQARTRPELPLKLVISDDRAAIIPFSLAPGGQSAAYLIHRSLMLVALESLFEAHWDRGLPLHAPGAVAAFQAGGPGGTERSDGRDGGLFPRRAAGRVGAVGQERTEPEPPAGHGLDAETRELLSLLAAGLTDTAIARAQGWSARTTQRRVQRLMSSLGATTRFQASLEASRRGWL
jgi:DNA-binding MarR family transcriptional regulator/DNA-binding CsgD family transcriptional regulator